MFNTTIRPGLLVSLKTSIKGNTKYRTTDLGTRVEGDTEESRWETERVTKDKAEQERAVKARSLARSKIQCTCVPSEFGLLCLRSKAGELDRAISEARDIANEFNKSAVYTRLTVRVIRGEIAQDDAEAISAINNEMSELIASMAEGLQSLDVTKVRDAANKARSVGAMLTDDARERVQAAIDVARKAAREIVRAAELGAVEIDEASIRKVMEARTSFLDLEDAAEVQAPEPVARPLDMDTEPTPDEKAMGVASVQVRMFDLD